jgi:predicted nucleic acid-binding protein
VNLGCPTCPALDALGDVVYDAGMLIALSANRPGAALVKHREFARNGLPIVPSPVIAQAWRSGATRAHLTRALKECAVICCYTETEWRRVGELIGRAGLPTKKRPDPIDGLVALTAVQAGAELVATSDVEDIQAYLDQLSGADSIVPFRV